MCQFNLLIANQKEDSDDLKRIITENGFHYRELENDSLSKQIGNNKKIILTTKGNCDCGSILGINHQDSSPKLNVEKEKKKLKKKKWSQTKIDRYLADKIKSEDKKIQDSRLSEETEEFNWIRLSEQLIREQIEFGILFHQFAGLIEEEEIKIVRINQKLIGELKKGELRNFRENELHWIKK